MTLDDVITTDLAAVGAESRRGAPGLDAALRALDERAADRARADLDRHGAATRSAIPGSALWAVRLAHVFADRVARTAAGAVALLATLGIVAVLRPAPSRPGVRSLVEVLVAREVVAMTALLSVLVLAVHALAGRAARRWWAHRLASRADGSRPARSAMMRLARAADRGALALPIAGATAAVALIAGVGAALGHEPWWLFLDDDPAPAAALSGVTSAVLLAILGAALTAVAIEQLARRGGVHPVREPREPRRAPLARRTPRAALARPAVTVAALLAGAIAIVVCPAPSPSYAFTSVADLARFEAEAGARAASLAVITLAALIVAAGAVLRRRRRELAILEEGDAEAPASPAAAPIDAQALPRVHEALSVEARGGSIAGGAATVAGAIAVLVLLGGATGYASMSHEVVDGVAVGPSGWRWLDWLARGGVTAWAVLASAALAARVAGRRLARRWFERQLERACAVDATATPRDPGDAREPATVVSGAAARQLDAWATAARVAAPVAVAAVFGTVGLTFGTDYGAYFGPHGARVAGIIATTLQLAAIGVAIGVGASVALAAAVARAPARPSAALQILAHPAIALFALVALGGVGYAALGQEPGLATIAGDIRSGHHTEPAITAIAATFVIAAGRALRLVWRDRRRAAGGAG